MTNTIQGSNAILSFYKDSFLPFMCFSDITINITGDTQAVATVNDGHWQKNKYKGLSWDISLSGIMAIDTDNFTAFDLLSNQLGFVNAIFRCAFTDSAGNIKSLQGEGLVNGNSISVTPGSMLTGQITLKGTGELKYFDGLIPCDTSIDSITITGQTASDGIIHVDYTYTGPVYQVKYRVDGIGVYGYALLGDTIDIPGLSVGPHSIELIPVCTNNYEGVSDSSTFRVTRALTCSLAVDSIDHTVTGSNVSLEVTLNATPGPGTKILYNIDGGAYITSSSGFIAAVTIINISGLTIGTHTVNIIPVCSNGVYGTDASDSFDVTSSSTISTINYSFIAIPGGSPIFQIFVNGVLVVNLSATGSGSVSAMTGQSILSRVSVAMAGRDMSLEVQDSTTSTMLYNHSQITPSGTTTDQYTTTANGDTYSVNGVISP